MKAQSSRRSTSIWKATAESFPGNEKKAGSSRKANSKEKDKNKSNTITTFISTKDSFKKDLRKAKASKNSKAPSMKVNSKMISNMAKEPLPSSSATSFRKNKKIKTSKFSKAWVTEFQLTSSEEFRGS